MKTPSDSGKISAEKLSALCRARGVKMRVSVLEETDSTNSDVARELRSRIAENPGVPVAPFAIFANSQTAGRGRAGRSWARDSAGNICVSFGFSPSIAPAEMANFTLWMGASICEMLVREHGVPASVKWPNDLFCSGKKFAGMLTDVHVDAARVRGVIFGIGLNVGRVPAEVENVATSLAHEIGLLGRAAPSVEEVAAELVSTVENAAEKFFSGTFAAEFPALWARHDMLRGRQVRAIYGEEFFAGIARGIDARGQILIAPENVPGELRAFSAGDVSLRGDF